MEWQHTVTRAAAWWMVVGVAVALSSCTYTPRVPEESTAVLTLRSDYLHNHPTGQYNEHIVKGEVVKGMNPVEVLASWGAPDSRLRIPAKNVEYWRYVAQDDLSNDWVLYTFTFEKRHLVTWEMSRHVSKLGAMEQARLDDPTLPAVQPPPINAVDVRKR